MANKRKGFEKRVAEALGAQRSLPLDGLPSRGPLDLLQLRAELGRRLRSSGGRPTDPEWTLRRIIPFQEQGWRDLERVAARCSQEGQDVSPSQLAALLIECGLQDLLRAGVDGRSRMDPDDLLHRLAGLGAERLAGEVVRLTDFDPSLRRQLELVALEGDSAGLAAALRRRVAGLKRATKFIPYRENFYELR